MVFLLRRRCRPARGYLPPRFVLFFLALVFDRFFVDFFAVFFAGLAGVGFFVWHRMATSQVMP
jgi:hypothetical protein